MSRPLNYTTRISARQTAGECVHILADAGAEAVALQYDAKQPTGLIFTLRTPQGMSDFRMPVDVAAMRKSLEAAERGAAWWAERAERHISHAPAFWQAVAGRWLAAAREQSELAQVYRWHALMLRDYGPPGACTCRLPRYCPHIPDGGYW